MGIETSITEEKIAIYRHQISTSIPHAEGRDIVIWGTREIGRIAKEIVESIAGEGAVLCFISSRPRSDMCYGLPLYTPDILDPSKHYVISTTAAEEVWRYLERKGFRWDTLGGSGKDWIWLHTAWHDDIVFSGCPVGRGTYGHESLTSFDLGLQVKRIGRFCSINGRAQAIAHNHSVELVTTHEILIEPRFAPASEKVWSAIESIAVPMLRDEFMSEDKLIEIGNDVWIGTNAVILSGVHIGDGAVVGAGAIVTKDVEPYEIVGGVPAKHIRYRFPKEIIDSFLRIKWWDWSLEKIEKNITLFYQPELFCKTFDPYYGVRSWNNSKT